MSDERLERLERRVMALEQLVRQMAAAQAGLRPHVEPEPSIPRPEAVAPPSPPVAGPTHPPVPPLLDPSTGPHQPKPAPATVPPLRPVAPPRRSLDSETWLGQRGLLGVGVLSLILAAGYFLKLAIDRDWISPVTRCLAGVVGGAAVGALGWRLAPTARRYGTALIGAGAGVMYLAVWAACRLYGLVTPSSGIAALSLIAVSLAMLAWALSAEPLALVAAIGAFAAPLLLGSDAGNPDLLLVYILTMAIGLGVAAALKAWRATMLVLVLAALLVTGAVSTRANASLLLGYGTVISTLGLAVALQRRWPETRIVAFVGGWSVVFAASPRLAMQWPVLAAALVFALPVWWIALERHDQWRDAILRGDGWLDASGGLFYFLVLPVPLVWAVHVQAPHWFQAHEGVAPLLVAVPYVAVWGQRARAFFGGVATALVLAGLADLVDGIVGVYAFALLGCLWLLAGRWRPAIHPWWLAVAGWAAADVRLMDELARRPATEAAFLGAWPVALAFTLGVGALVARERSARPGDPTPKAAGPVLWSILGLLLLGGVTQEIARAWQMAGLPPATAELATGLSVSAWWLAAAAILVVAGFRRQWRSGRLAGLAVALVAVAKVLLRDLDQLDALYRVASVAILAVVTLSLAWLYNRQGPRAAGERPGVDEAGTAG